MDEETLLEELNAFVCDQGLWNVFLDRMRDKGYTDEELEDI